jgi:hypothetical protein
MSLFDDLKLQLFRVTAHREVVRMSDEDIAARDAGKPYTPATGTGEYGKDTSLVWARNAAEAWALFNDSRKINPRGMGPRDRVELADEADTEPTDDNHAPFVADEAEELETAAA